MPFVASSSAFPLPGVRANAAPADTNPLPDRAGPGPLPVRVGNCPQASLGPVPALASLRMARLASELLATSLTSSGLPLGQHLSALVQHGVQAGQDVHQLQEAARWLHAPFGDAVAAAFGEASRELVPYLLDQLLLTLFPTLEDGQRQPLTALIRAHAGTLPLANWARALSVPRDGQQGGGLRLRVLDDAEQWAAVRAGLTPPVTQGSSGLPQVAAATAALGAAALASWALPAAAVPALLTGSAAFLGITVDAALADADADAPTDVRSAALRGRADALLQTLLPTWRSEQRDALYELWAERPQQGSLLSVSLHAAEALDASKGCIDSALAALRESAATSPPAVGTRTAVTEALAQLFLAILPQGPRVAAGTVPAFPGAPGAIFNAGHAHPLQPARAGMALLAEHSARAEFRAGIQQMLDLSGKDADDPRTAHERRLDKARLRLLHARAAPPGPRRMDAIRDARHVVDGLRNPAPLVALARSGRVGEAMELNSAAALQPVLRAAAVRQVAAQELPVRARTGALTEPGVRSLTRSDDPAASGATGAMAMALRPAPPVAIERTPPFALTAAHTGPTARTAAPAGTASAQTRLRVGLGLMPDLPGAGQESAIADYLDLRVETRDGRVSPMRAELAGAWREQLRDQARAGRARNTLSDAAADIVARLAEEDREGAAAAGSRPGRFSLALKMDGRRSVAVPGALVMTGTAGDASPRTAAGPVVVIVPGIGLLEYTADTLHALVRDMDAHPLLRAAFYGLIPLEKLQPRPGDPGEVTLAFPPLDADATGEEIIERVLQGGIDIGRAGARRAQAPGSLSERVTPFLAMPGVLEQALAQLADQGLLREPVRDASGALALATAWSDYLHALVEAPSLPALQSPQDYATGAQLQQHIGQRLQRQLAAIGIDAPASDIRVRWQEVRFRPEPIGLPPNPGGPALLPPIEHDLSLAELAARNIGLVDIPFSATAQAFDAQGNLLASLTPALMRDWIRTLDLDSSYRAHLQQQFDSSRRGSPGELRLRAFRSTFPARVALEEQLAAANAGDGRPSLLRQVLSHPQSRVVEHRGRVQQAQVGPLTLTTRAVIDDTYVFNRTSVLPGSLAVRTEDGHMQAYLAGLQPSPLLSADDEAGLNALLDSERVRGWLKDHLPDATQHHDLDDRDSWSELSVTDEAGNVLEGCYQRWVQHLQHEADDRLVSDKEQLGKDLRTVLGGLYEFAENLLPFRLEAASVLARTLGPLLGRDGGSGSAGRLAMETALLRIFAYAGSSAAMAVAAKRPLLASPLPRVVRSGADTGADPLDGAASARYLQTAQGEFRIPAEEALEASGMTVLLDPINGQSAGGMARYHPDTRQWRAEPALACGSAEYSGLAVALHDAQLRHMNTQGNGVYDLDGAQYVRIGAQWYQSEVRSELGGGRYLMGAGGRVRSDLLLARVDDAWVVTQRPRGRLLGGQPGNAAPPPPNAVLDALRQAVPAARLLDDNALERTLSVHGPVGEAVTAPLRRALRERAQQTLLGRIGAGKASFDTPDALQAGRMALLCALAHDPVLGQGRRVELYTGSAATGQRRIVIGDGAEVLLRLEVGKQLPTLDALTTLLNPTVVAAALGLAADHSPADLAKAMTAHLQQTVRAHQETVRDAVRRLADDWDVASPEVAALQLQFGIDRSLAEDVCERQPLGTATMLRYERPEALLDTLADASARSAERALRDALLEGRMTSADALTLLGDTLGELLPAWTVSHSVQPDGSLHLHLAPRAEDRHGATIVFGTDGGDVEVSGQAQRHKTWQQAVRAVIGNDAPEALQKRNGLSNAMAGLLRRREVAAPTDRVLQARSTLQQMAAQPACPSATGLCPASARRPDHDDFSRQLGLRDTAVRLRQEAFAELRVELDATRTVAIEWLRKHAPDVAVGDDARLVDTIKARWRSRGGRPHELQAFLQAHGAAKSLPKANILITDVALEVDGTPVDWNQNAFVSSGHLSGRAGFSRGDQVQFKDVMLIAQRRPGHEHIAKPGEADFYVPDLQLHGVMTDAHPFGRFVVEPRAQLPGKGVHQDDRTELVRIGSQAHLEQLMRGFELVGDARPKVGDHVFLSSVRRCTESQFLSEVADALSTTLPGVWEQPHLRNRVTGSVALFSDRVPCLDNCQRLMRSAAETLPGVDFKLGYGDPPGRGGVIVEHVGPPRLFPLP